MISLLFGIFALLNTHWMFSDIEELGDDWRDLDVTACAEDSSPWCRWGKGAWR